ncbi:putative toxin-antitoxin system toxin component, PIN family [Candidatus Woesearchaeota archaeon]|nr:putative toxin-antitoxin system toxin component, PIN family [Candidatus Woesearchaeota archaeon]
MGQTKLTLDTNNLISALGWKGKPHDIFAKCVSGELELITSPKQLEELQRVLDYPKFNFTSEQKERFLNLILEIATIVETHDIVKTIKEDPDDNVILETALAGNAKYIVTGDSHLLQLKEYGGIKIVTPNDFLNEIKIN